MCGVEEYLLHVPVAQILGTEHRRCIADQSGCNAGAGVGRQHRVAQDIVLAGDRVVTRAEFLLAAGQVDVVFGSGNAGDHRRVGRRANDDRMGQLTHLGHDNHAALG